MRVHFASVRSQKFIDPTGSYKLQSKTIKKNGKTYGWFGDIQIKLIDSQRIAMSFFICRGAPSYNSGSFVDTLAYRNGVAVYKSEGYPEEGWQVTFSFKRNYIDLKEETKERGVCWGYGVVAEGRFKKYSAKVPEIKHPLTDD